VALLVGLWLTRFLLHSLGTEEYGLWVIVFQVLALLDLTDFGVMALLPREVGYRTGSSDDPVARASAVRELLSATRRITLWQLPLVGSAAMVGWALCLGAQTNHPATVPLGVAALVYVLLFPSRMYSATLVGLQDQMFLGVTNALVSIAQAIVVVIMVLCGLGFWALVLGWAFSRCLNTLVCRARLQYMFAGILPREVLGRPCGQSGRLVRGGLWLSIGNLAMSLHFGADVILVGTLLGPTAVIVFACTRRLINVATFQVDGMMSVAGPALSELRTADCHDRLVHASTALGQLMLTASGLVACVLIMINQGFVAWWVGAESFGGATLTILLLSGMVLRHFAYALSQILLCLGHERALAWIILADGAFVVVTTACLATWCGLLAVPVASILGAALVGLPLFLFLLCRAPSFAIGQFLGAYVPWAWRFAVLASGLSWLSMLWVPEGLLQLALSAVAVTVVYTGLMLPALVRTPLWGYIQPRIAAMRARIDGAPAA
jgi:O-antigen/teichoic acid export membrane protein